MSVERMTSHERLRAALAGRAVDRPTVICPGGMMSMAVREVMASCGVGWPEAHVESESMAELALAMQAATGFDTLAVPFCMTVEATLFGADVDLGTALTQPRVSGPILPPDGQGDLPPPMLDGPRVRTVIAAIERLVERRGAVPVVGNVAGPFSVLAELVDPMMLLRWTRRDPVLVERYMSVVTDGLAAYARRQVEAGAGVMCISEPTATGDIMSGSTFAASVAPHLSRLCRSITAAGVPVMVHICGDVTRLAEVLAELPIEALSVDSMVDVVALGRRGYRWQVMGNVSPLMLEAGPVERVESAVGRLVHGGVRLIAPACGVVPTTPVRHLRAMAEAVRATAHNCHDELQEKLA